MGDQSTVELYWQWLHLIVEIHKNSSWDSPPSNQEELNERWEELPEECRLRLWGLSQDLEVLHGNEIEVQKRHKMYKQDELNNDLKKLKAFRDACLPIIKKYGLNASAIPDYWVDEVEKLVKLSIATTKEVDHTTQKWGQYENDRIMLSKNYYGLITHGCLGPYCALIGVRSDSEDVPYRNGHKNILGRSGSQKYLFYSESAELAIGYVESQIANLEERLKRKEG